jgi:hypothetical protein
MAKQQQKRGHWLLWWQVDQEEIATAVAGYAKKNPFKSPRGIAACCFIFSSALTAAFHIAKSTTTGDFSDVAVFLVLALFVYLGHRWAMLGGMAWWTFSKLVLLYSTVMSNNPSNPGGLFITSVIWWCIYMHALWFAFRVEQARRKAPKVAEAAEVFS